MSKCTRRRRGSAKTSRRSRRLSRRLGRRVRTRRGGVKRARAREENSEQMPKEKALQRDFVGEYAILDGKLKDLQKRKAIFEDGRRNGNDGEHHGHSTEFDAAISDVYAKKAKLWDEYWIENPEAKVKYDAEQAAISAQQAAHYAEMNRQRILSENPP